MKTKTLIALATAWGPHHGGINSFNFDFLKAFGVAFHEYVRVLCVVPKADEKDKADARRSFVELIDLPCPPGGERLEASHAAEIVRHLKATQTDIGSTVWLGHDLFTGGAAVEAAKQTETRSAVIHHMSYAAYESFKSGSGKKAKGKMDQQREIFHQADLRLAVGPLLRDELDDLLHGSEVSMLIPGLPEIEPKELPRRLMAVMFGRLDPDTDRIKQGCLGVAAFAAAYRKALNTPGLLQSLRDRPRLKLYGINPADESKLREFANEQAGAALDLLALPFDTDRPKLFGELAYSSIALMPSWHEGFGLVGWEAIGAGVPLILSKTSGLYRLLDEELAGAGTGCVHGVDVRGKEAEEPPFFQEADVEGVAESMIAIAGNLNRAKRSALQLRELLGEYTWKNCAEQFAAAVGWDIPDDASPIPPAPTTPEPPIDSVSESFITVPSPVWKSGKGSPDSLLLRAEEACVPFHPDREDLLSEILRWTEDPEFPVGVRLHVGSGGSGKTRLLLEACRRLDPSWFRGFLDSGLAPADIKKRFTTLLHTTEKAFVVLDYAETRRAELAALVESALPLMDKRVRIVLLARDAGEWWDRLPVDFSRFEQFFGGRASCGPYCLPDLHANTNTRNAAYVEALNAFGGRLGIDPARRIPETLPDLSAEHFSSPLYLQMAALLSYRGERAETATGLTDALLRHEERYWKRLAESHVIPDGERAIAHLLTLTTLAGGLLTARDGEKRYIASDGPKLSSGDFNRLFHSLCGLYPGRQGLQPLRPDLLGEALAARAFNSAGDGGNAWLDAVLGKPADRDARRHALTVLTRLTKHRPAMEPLLVEGLRAHFPACVAEIVEVGLETGEPLARAAVEAFDRLPIGTQSQVASLLMRRLPDQTIRLGELAFCVTEFRTEQARNDFKRKQTSKNAWDYLTALNSQGIRALHIGSYTKAEQMFRQAEDLCTLVQKEPRFPEFASALAGNIASNLRMLNRYGEALEYREESLRLHRRLAEINPKRFEPNLASSLLGVSLDLSELARYSEALEFAEESHCLCEKLHKSNPDTFLPMLSKALLSKGFHFQSLGEYEEALENSENALRFYRQLAERRADRYEPDLAVALNHVSNLMSTFGRNDEALEYSKQALLIFRKLAETRPNRFDAVLVVSLNNMAYRLAEVGQLDTALDLSKQSLSLCQRLAETDQDRFEVNLAGCLENTSCRLAGLGWHDEALPYANQALELYQRLAETQPERFESQLSGALSDVSNRQSELGDYENALAHEKKARIIYRRLAEAYPTREAEASLATNLNCLYLAWLAGHACDHPTELVVTEESLPYVLPHRRPILQAQQAFTFSCIQNEPAKMKRVVDICNGLPIHQRRPLAYFYAIASLYLNHHQPTPENQQRAETAFREYSEPRQGRLPHDFLDTLKRLGVDLAPFLANQKAAA
jgi:glycosyltransferase involved in cell wall biosynthesis